MSTPQNHEAKKGSLSEFENSRKDDIRKVAQVQTEAAKRDRLEKKEFQAELDSRVKVLVGSIEVPQVEALNNLYAVAANCPDAKLRNVMTDQALAAKHKFDSDQMRMYREMVAMDKLLFELKESEEAAHTKMEADLAAARSRLEESKSKIDQEQEHRYKTEERLQREGKIEVYKDMNKLHESRRKDFLAKKVRFDEMESALVEEEQKIRAICAKTGRKRQYGEQMVKLCHDQWEIEEGGRRLEDRVGYVPNRLSLAQTYMALEDGCQAMMLRYCATGVKLFSRCFRVTSRNLKWCFCGGENEDLFSHPDALKTKEPPAHPLIAKVSTIILGSQYRVELSRTRSGGSFRVRSPSLTPAGGKNAYHRNVSFVGPGVTEFGPERKPSLVEETRKPILFAPLPSPSVNAGGSFDQGMKRLAVHGTGGINRGDDTAERRKSFDHSDTRRDAKSPSAESLPSPSYNGGKFDQRIKRLAAQGQGVNRGDVFEATEPKRNIDHTDFRKDSKIISTPENNLVSFSSAGSTAPKKKRLNLFDQATFEEVSKAKKVEDV